MNVSRPSVHPVDEPLPATTEGANNNVPLRARVKDLQGMPGTPGGLILRVCQFVSALASVSVMSTTTDFPSVTAFRYLVAAMGLQSFWSLALIFVDIHALLVGRNLHNIAVVTSFAVGDGITSTLSFAAASASAGITVLLGNDLDRCDVNQCLQFETATAMAFVSWFAVSPSFLLNFWSLATW